MVSNIRVALKPGFRKLLLANVVITVGFWFTYVAAFDIYVFDTDIGVVGVSALAVAGVGPQVVGGLVGGVFVDRYNRRRLLVGSYVLCIPLVLLLVFYRSLWLAYGVFLGTSLLYSLSRPAYKALVPDLVSDEQLESANGLISSSDSGAQILGPAVAGAVLLVTRPEVLFLLDAGTYLCSASLIFLLSAPARSPEDPEGFGTSFVGGLRYIRQAPSLMFLMITAILSFTAIGIFEAIVPYFVREVLHQDGSAYSVFLSSVGVGSFAGGVTVGKITTVMKTRSLASTSVGILGVSIGIFSFDPGFVPLVVASAFIGFSIVCFVSSSYSTFHREVDDSHLGRVLGLFKSSTRGGQVLAMAASGAFATVVGTRLLFAVAGIALVTGAVGWQFSNRVWLTDGATNVT